MSTQHATLYRPLEGDKAIRFIELLPGKPSDVISVNFIYDTLLMRPAPMYEATSYTWGSPNPTTTILCDGIEFELQQNAHDFLQQLRLPDRSRMLWMDCICINQEDVTERAKQVEMMHVIYRDATAVIAWIGVQDESDSEALDFVFHLDWRSMLRQHLITMLIGNSGRRTKSYFFDTETQIQQGKSLVAAVMQLLTRPWFRRVWIQQEMAVNRDTRILCGCRELSLERVLALGWLMLPRDSSGWPWPWCVVDFNPAWRSVQALRSIHANRMSEFRVSNDKHYDVPHESLPSSATTLLSENTISRHFAVLVATCCAFEATDPRDRVYAMYNLDKQFLTCAARTQQVLGRPRVNYTIPWEKVFIRTAKYLCKTHADLTLTLAGRIQQLSDVHIPSWVPDLRNEYLEDSFAPHEQWSAGGRAYDPGLRYVRMPASRPDFLRPIPEYWYIDDRGKKRHMVTEAMEITAILQDKIAYCSPQPKLPMRQWRDNLEEVRQKLDADLDFVSTDVVKYFTGESALDAYAGTIIANTTPEDDLATADYERDGFALWQSWLKSAECPNNEPEYHRAVNNTEPLTEHLFIVSNHGLMCLVPSLARAGDYVAILNGYRYPVALRKVGPEDGQYYELLGQCYMHRMMRGRAWNLIQEFKLKYRPGSEDEVVHLNLGAVNQLGEESGGDIGVFPFNAKSDYRNVVRVLGKRRIALV